MQRQKNWYQLEQGDSTDDNAFASHATDPGLIPHTAGGFLSTEPGVTQLCPPKRAISNAKC